MTSALEGVDLAPQALELYGRAAGCNIRPAEDADFSSLVARTVRTGLGCKAHVVIDVISDPN